MKKVLLFILFLVMFLFLSTSVYANSGSELIKRVNSDTKISDSFINLLYDATDDDAKIQVQINEIPNLVNHYNESYSFYTQLALNETDETIKSLISRIGSTVKKRSEILTEIRNAIENLDDKTFTSAWDSYDSNVDELNNEINEINSIYSSSDYDWLPWAFWITLITSFILFIISRGHPILPAEKVRNEFEKALFKSSLWPFAGATVSYVWQLMTPPGETYYVFWWLIVIGYIQFARGLYAYLRYSRPAINIAKHEQEDRLNKLLRSESYQEEDLKGKLEKIKKIKPTIEIGKKE
jgi:hypothetical protein